jgi:hypothetical protein
MSPWLTFTSSLSLAIRAATTSRRNPCRMSQRSSATSDNAAGRTHIAQLIDLAAGSSSVSVRWTFRIETLAAASRPGGAIVARRRAGSVLSRCWTIWLAPACLVDHDQRDERQALELGTAA